MRTLDCPKCPEPMFVAEYGSIEIDCCASCGGIWLDGGELEALTGERLARLTPDPELGPPEIDCPFCTDKLIKFRHPQTGVVLDRCPNGHGIWFDAGELEQVLAAYKRTGTDDADARAAGALADFFDGHSPKQPKGDET